MSICDRCATGCWTAPSVRCQACNAGSLFIPNGEPHKVMPPVLHKETETFGWILRKQLRERCYDAT